MTIDRAVLRWLLAIVAAIGGVSAAHADVGYRTADVQVAGGAAIPVAIWYPTSATATDQQIGLFTEHVAIDAPIKGTHLPLIVISHGNGGSKDGHYDTALALAAAGFVVAALEHPGDNYHDQSRATQVAERPLAVSRVIDFMTVVWGRKATIDPHRIGAFGFSSGGFTVLALAGGRPDLSLLASHCRDHPKFYDCMLAGQHSAPGGAALPDMHDRRVRAIVAAAPALGFTFVGGLSHLRIPVQLWRADDDQILPAPYYADAVRAALPTPPRFETVAGAGHFDFLAPCSAAFAQLAPPIVCRSAPGFDRAAFHQRFNAAVTEFFVRKLKL